ncbi:MAG: adenylyltransferase/cytidyltransferase family protein [Candidatus Iainarchaeum sp.]|jgi:cytidyltransferase-like protein|nr:MAG: FAD synthase [archaeon ADurb.Bin336]
MKIIITSGYFDPIHEGHIECLNLAKKLGDKLIVIINSDEQAILKKGKPFMNQKIREIIVSNLKAVDETLIAVDKDGSVCESIKLIHSKYNKGNELIFAKGGDRFSNEVPEKKVCDELNIKIVDGLGSKINSSKNYYTQK